MSNYSILITGCSSGIGLASARTLKRRGWRVLATARRPEDLLRLEHEEGLEVIPLELSDAESVARCADAALERTERQLYALFNNAAYGQPGAVEDVPAEALRRQLEVNVVGAHALTRRLIPAMRARGRGRIVNCSSVLGFVAAPFRGAYCASKFALEGLTDALRLELAGTGLQVVLIEPGPIRTRFAENAVSAGRRWIDIEGSVHRDRYHAMLALLEQGGREAFKLEPEAVAATLMRALESRWPRPRYRVTLPTHAAAAAKRLLPARVMDWIAARG